MIAKGHRAISPQRCRELTVVEGVSKRGCGRLFCFAYDPVGDRLIEKLTAESWPEDDALRIETVVRCKFDRASSFYLKVKNLSWGISADRREQLLRGYAGKREDDKILFGPKRVSSKDFGFVPRDTRKIEDT